MGLFKKVNVFTNASKMFMWTTLYLLLLSCDAQNIEQLFSSLLLGDGKAVKERERVCE